MILFLFISKIGVHGRIMVVVLAKIWACRFPDLVSV
jgi:hypothetical protein